MCVEILEKYKYTFVFNIFGALKMRTRKQSNQNDD